MAYRIAALRVVKTPITIAPEGVTVGDPVCETNPADCPACTTAWYCAAFDDGIDTIPLGPVELTNPPPSGWFVYSGPFDTEGEVPTCEDPGPATACATEDPLPGGWMLTIPALTDLGPPNCINCSVLTGSFVLLWDSGYPFGTLYVNDVGIPTGCDCEGGGPDSSITLECDSLVDPAGWYLRISCGNTPSATYYLAFASWSATGPNTMDLVYDFGCDGYPATITITAIP